MSPSNATGNPTVSYCHGHGVLPIVAAPVVALNGSPMLLVAFGNISDLIAMPITNLDDVMWRAITNETLQNIAYAGYPLRVEDRGCAAGGCRVMDRGT